MPQAWKEHLVVLAAGVERKTLVILAAGVDPRRVTLLRNRHVAGVTGLRLSAPLMSLAHHMDAGLIRKSGASP